MVTSIPIMNSNFPSMAAGFSHGLTALILMQNEPLKKDSDHLFFLHTRYCPLQAPPGRIQFLKGFV